MNLEESLKPENWDELTVPEWREYLTLVDAFSVAKKEKRYEESDSLRLALSEWQGHTPEAKFIEMHDTGRYTWRAIFEQQGENSHRFNRIQKRLNERLLSLGN